MLFRRLLPLYLGGLLLLPGATATDAHDVPDEMKVQAFVQQDGRHVEMLVRTPLVLLTSLSLPKRGPGYLDIDRLGPHLDRAAEAVAKAMPLYADGTRVALQAEGTQLAQPSSTAFGDIQAARSHLAAALPPPDTNIFWNQGYFDTRYVATLPHAEADLALDPWASSGLSGRVKVYLRYLTEGTVTAYAVHGKADRLYLDPSRVHAAKSFTVMGIEHIFGGIDHVLFVLAIVLPFTLRDFWTLVKVVTGFTVAHSITLSLAALGVIAPGEWFPPLVEALIAVSILYMCLENIFAVTTGRGAFATRWLTTAGFGLIHGFGFSFVLAEELQFAGEHLVLSLAAFNVGVELGQLLILALALPLLGRMLAERRVRTVGIVVVSALIGHTAWHWSLERLGALQYVQWPEVPLVELLTAVAALAAVAWLARARLRGARTGAAERSG